MIYTNPNLAVVHTQIKEILDKAEKVEISENLNIIAIIAKIKSLQDCKKQLNDLSLSVKLESDINLDISKIQEKIDFLNNGLTRHRVEKNHSNIVNLGKYPSETPKTSESPSPQALVTLIQKKCPHGENFEFTLGFDKYCIIHDKTRDAPITIQKKNSSLHENKLSIQTDANGQIQSVLVDEQIVQSTKSEKFLNQWIPILNAGYLALSSTYDVNSGKVEVLEQGIKAIPEEYLIRFNQLMSDSSISQITFLDNKGKMVTLDQYLKNLIQVLIDKYQLSFENLGEDSFASSIYHPQAQNITLLDKNEMSLFYELGKLNTLVIKRNLPLRNFLANGVLEASDSIIRANEADKSFENLSNYAKLKMAQAFLIGKRQLDSSNDSIRKKSFLDPIEDLLNKKNKDFINDYKKLISEKTEDVKDNEKLEEILNYVLKETKIGKNLLPIHAFTQGRVSVLRSVSEVKPLVISPTKDQERVSISDESVPVIEPLIISEKKEQFSERQLIANSFKFQPDFHFPQDQCKKMKKNVEWLKKWILDSVNGASDQEVKAFLIYYKGTSDFPEGQIISYTKQREKDDIPYKPFPIIENGKLHIAGLLCKDGDYNDYDKDNFIRSLKFILSPYIQKI